VLVGHPFNTVKARLQAVSAPSTGLAVLSMLLKQEGARGLFKGMGPPLLGTSAICAVLFHANGAALQATAGIEDPRNTDAVPLHLVAVAGAAAGAAQVAVCSPLELVMIRLQTQHVFSPGRSLYAGPIDCALKIVQAGGARALYQGLPATLLRDPPNYFSYFLGYEVAKRAQTPVGGSSKDLSALQLLAAGGVAGIAAQLTQLPMDVVKTRMQSQPDANPLYRSTWDCYKKTYAEGGLAAFYKGIGPVLARAFPANAVTFLGFELALEALR
jgi:solute carrier family 25 carnitine/acylcarnitine transporter 20/29